jgi:hypothetical protein
LRVVIDNTTSHHILASMAGVSERSQPATNPQYQDTGSPYFNGEPDSLASMDWSIRTFPEVRLRMKKNEAEAEIRSLMTRWKRSEHPDTPVSQLHSGDFITWLEKNSPGHLRFRSPITGVRYDIDMWFDDEFKIPGR